MCPDHMIFSKKNSFCKLKAQAYSIQFFNTYLRTPNTNLPKTYFESRAMEFSKFSRKYFLEFFQICLTMVFRDFSDLINTGFSYLFNISFLNPQDISKNSPKTCFKNPQKDLKIKVLGIVKVCIVHFDVSIAQKKILQINFYFTEN